MTAAFRTGVPTRLGWRASTAGSWVCRTTDCQPGAGPVSRGYDHHCQLPRYASCTHAMLGPCACAKGSGGLASADLPSIMLPVAWRRRPTWVLSRTPEMIAAPSEVLADRGSALSRRKQVLRIHPRVGRNRCDESSSAEARMPPRSGDLAEAGRRRPRYLPLDSEPVRRLSVL